MPRAFLAVTGWNWSSLTLEETQAPLSHFCIGNAPQGFGDDVAGCKPSAFISLSETAESLKSSGRFCPPGNHPYHLLWLPTLRPREASACSPQLAALDLSAPYADTLARAMHSPLRPPEACVLRC